MGMINQAEILNLPIDDRVLLAHQILGSVEAELDDAPLTLEQRNELERRIADMEANPEAGSSWEEVKQRLRDLHP